MAFFATLLPELLMCAVIYSGFFASAYVEIGEEYFAEKMVPTWEPYLPKWLKMPFNTCVNVGYVILGAAWCAIVSVALRNKHLSSTDAFFFYFFNFMSCIYGPISALRILTQMHGFAIMDQWYNMPFVMWVLIWGLYLRFGWSTWRSMFLYWLSFGSFIIVLHNNMGFEIELGVHTILAVVGAVVAWTRHSQAKVRTTCLISLISIVGFLAFKMFDLDLVKYHVIFQYVSGHFLSKIFDISQLYCVNKFFLSVTLAANADAKKKKA